MELRAELCPPEVAPERIAELCAAIEAVERLLERGAAADAAIAAFNAETGHNYQARDFACYWESQSIEAFALQAARPARPRVADVTRDELVEIVRRVKAVDADEEYYVRLLETNVAHPAVIDLIYHPPSELANASPEAIIDAALSYRPVEL
jgi:hypothetical protein